MKLHNAITTSLALSILVVPATAHAQLGSFAKKALGGSEGEVSGPDAEVFLDKALKSTKNVMISAALLSQALTDRNEIASQKASIDAIKETKSFDELGAHETKLKSDLAVLSERKDLEGDLTTVYNDADEKQKKIIGAAIANLALGVYRNVDLASNAPGMVKSVGSNPKLMNRVGEFKKASSLVGLQGKGLGTIGKTLPKVMTTLKVKPLPEAESTVASNIDV